MASAGICPWPFTGSDRGRLSGSDRSRSGSDRGRLSEFMHGEAPAYRLGFPASPPVSPLPPIFSPVSIGKAPRKGSPEPVSYVSLSPMLRKAKPFPFLVAESLWPQCRKARESLFFKALSGAERPSGAVWQAGKGAGEGHRGTLPLPYTNPA
jgi:hypothetical protein